MTEKIAPFLDEQLIVSEMKTVERHLEECSQCLAELNKTQKILQTLRETPAASTDTEHEFVDSVWNTIDHPKTQTLRWIPLLAACLVGSIAIALGVWMYTSSGTDNFDRSPSPSEFVARSGNAQQTLRTHTGVIPLVVSKQKIHDIETTQKMGPNDGVTFRYTNIYDRPTYFMAFAIDQKNELHWFYPAYSSEKDNPKSIRLKQNVRDDVLPDIVQPIDVAEGVLKIVTIASERPYHVKQIEEKIGNRGATALAEIFDKSEPVRQWTVKYSSR